MKIKSVVIVGGGSSGWITAASICKFFNGDVKVSLVESKTIETIGVGESTLLSFNEYLDLIGLDDKDWMKECNATYKSSIRFTDFRDVGTVFEYPFGWPRKQHEGLMSWCQLAATYDMPPESFAEYHNDNTFLANHNRLTKNEDGKLRNFDFHGHTAYHLDAELFGQYMKNNICKDVEHHYDNIVGVRKDDDGYVTSLIGQLHGKYDGDLFIDCTGFKSLLLEKEMGSEFCSYKPWLPNDKALVGNINYTDKNKQLTNVTNCTALNNGWVWDIPLWNRVGKGYVYSSDFVSDDIAEMELIMHLGTDDIDLRKIDIKHGEHKEAWVKNVVGIGLSYAFVEPLESTGLVSTYDGVIKLLEMIRRKNFNINRFDIDSYNMSMSDQMTQYRDFVSLHYVCSSRCDTPYWKHLTQEKSYIGLGERKYYTPGTVVNPIEDVMYKTSIKHLWNDPIGGYFYIMAGLGYKPLDSYQMRTIFTDNPSKKSLLKQWYNIWLDERKDLDEYVKTLPSSYEFLKEHIYELTDDE